MRDSPLLTIVPTLVDAMAQVTDPEDRKEGEMLLPNVRWAEDAYGAAAGANVVVLLTEWNQFHTLDLVRLGAVMAGNAFTGLRNVYDQQDAAHARFRYASIRRPDAVPV